MAKARSPLCCAGIRERGARAGFITVRLNVALRQGLPAPVLFPRSSEGSWGMDVAGAPLREGPDPPCCPGSIVVHEL